jgi:POT family proton-dependent oligopeptide transporter
VNKETDSMVKFQYKTTPTQTDKNPPGIFHILASETTERFAYYGMTLILTEFMTKHLQGGNMSGTGGISWYHNFKCVTYLFPILGAIIADLWLGKFRTIILFSILYCFGLLSITIDQSRTGLYLCMVLVAIGSGFIKPCMSANLGDQFGKQNQHLMAKIYNWFYFAINIGAFIGPFIAAQLMDSPKFGPRWAFGLTFVVMVCSIIIFWSGRKSFVHAPIEGGKFLKSAFTGEGLKAVLRLSVLFIIISAFYTLYELSGSAWIVNAEKLNKVWLGHHWVASQIPDFNALFIMILIPVFSYVVYPVLGKFFRLTAKRKIAIGMFLIILPFFVMISLEHRIMAGEVPSIGWQFLANLLLTIAEIFVSISCLEFAYTQAPAEMKSFVMSLYLAASIGLGNLFTSLINQLISPGTFLNNSLIKYLHIKIDFSEGPGYYWVFIIYMFIVAVIFAIFAAFYKGKTYSQDDAPAAA